MVDNSSICYIFRFVSPTSTVNEIEILSLSENSQRKVQQGFFSQRVTCDCFCLLRPDISCAIPRKELPIGEKINYSHVILIYILREISIEEEPISDNFSSSFSDGACAHPEKNATICDLIDYKVDFGLGVCRTFTATRHIRRAGNGMGATIKSTTRRGTLVKQTLVRLSERQKIFYFLILFISIGRSHSIFVSVSFCVFILSLAASLPKI